MLTCFTHIIGKYPKTVYTLSEDDLENLSLDKWIELYSIAKERSRKKNRYISHKTVHQNLSYCLISINCWVLVLSKDFFFALLLTTLHRSVVQPVEKPEVQVSFAFATPYTASMINTIKKLAIVFSPFDNSVCYLLIDLYEKQAWCLQIFGFTIKRLLLYR